VDSLLWEFLENYFFVFLERNEIMNFTLSLTHTVQLFNTKINIP